MTNNIPSILGGEIMAFITAAMSGVFEFGILTCKTFIIAVIGGIGGMFGKWIWNKFSNYGNNK